MNLVLRENTAACNSTGLASENRRGPKIEPWGIPQIIEEDQISSI